MEGNSFKANRKGLRLCAAFNRGECSPSSAGNCCPRDPGFVHQCARCLDATHGMHTCFRSDFPAQKAAKTQTYKGGGKSSKGKGKGKSSKGRWQ